LLATKSRIPNPWGGSFLNKKAMKSFTNVVNQDIICSRSPEGAYFARGDHPKAATRRGILCSRSKFAGHQDLICSYFARGDHQKGHTLLAMTRMCLFAGDHPEGLICSRSPEGAYLLVITRRGLFTCDASLLAITRRGLFTCDASFVGDHPEGHTQ
jgi:hypothetical protein